jgi:hypothetical protein
LKSRAKRWGRPCAWRTAFGVGRGLAFALAFAVGLPACPGTKEPAPVAALADTTGAGIEFAPIRDEWDDPSDKGQARLRQKLELFLARHPEDGLAPLARIYLVLSLMDEPADWARADELLARVPEPPKGSLHDLYLIASARELRRHDEPQAAFDLLGPLVGKMVDPVARGMLEEEVTHDALLAHHDYEAIAYMDTWIRGSGEEQRERVEAKVKELLAGMPESVLENSLRTMRIQGSSGYGTDVQRLVTQRLAAIAVERSDAVLARWLLDVEGGEVAAMLGEVGVALGDLATSRRGLGEVAGRTIGLLLPTDSTDLRDEAADVERGVAWALDLPRTKPDGGDGTRLVTRDDGGDPARMTEGLEELAGEGASIILTALDGAAADQAVAWGDRTKIAVVVIDAPATKKPGDYAFVIGEPERGVLNRMTEVLGATRPGAKVAPVVEGDAATLFGQGYAAGLPTLLAPISCDVEAARAGESRFPLGAWERDGVRAWLLAGSADCARDVMREAGGRARGSVFALSLIASVTTERPHGARLVVASAGVVPSAASGAEDPREADVKGLVARLGGRPDWWTALGRDAAMLARRALANAPTDTVTTAVEVAQRRAAARDALLSAQARLWSTDETGFGGSHALPRTLRMVDVQVP